jgi:polyisoprenoid-binding protein YceI
MRDQHLRSAELFESSTYPKMTFRSTSVRQTGEAFELTGLLTVTNTEQPVSFEVMSNGFVVDPRGNDGSGFSAREELDRRDFGVNFNALTEASGVVVSDRIEVSVEVEGILRAE